jgi:enterochelin esterase-like enzyme
MRAQGVPLEYHEYPGDHAWAYWRTHSAQSISWLGARLSTDAGSRRR